MSVMFVAGHSFIYDINCFGRLLTYKMSRETTNGVYRNQSVTVCNPT